MKNLIVAIVFWWSSLRHRVIARLLWLGLWVTLTFDLAWFVYRLRAGDGFKFIAALVVFFLLTDIIFGVISLLCGDKKYGFLGGVFPVEVEEGWMNQPL